MYRLGVKPSQQAGVPYPVACHGVWRVWRQCTAIIRDLIAVAW